MQRSHIAAPLTSEADMVLITEHKTARTHGSLGRYLPNDVKYVFNILVEFADAGKDLLFVPPNKGVDAVQIHKLADDFKAMWCPEHESPEPTLMRKDLLSP